MKTQLKILAAVALLAMASTALAQTVPPPVEHPVDSLGWLNLIIAAIVPVVLAGVKTLVPKIPSVALPFLAPAVGLALAQIEAWVTGHPAKLLIGAVMGGLGVALREMLDQARKNGAGKPNGTIPTYLN